MFDLPLSEAGRSQQCVDPRMAAIPIRNRQQPNLSKRLHNGAASDFCGFCLGPGRVDIQVPKGLWLVELSDSLMGDDPTPYFACSFSNRFANLRRRFLATKEQHGTH
jgi:hypothetical protein